MRPIETCPDAELRQIRYVLCDIDDTLTDGGRLGARAYSAMADLQAAGIKVIPITGRPAGWCDLIARQWPVAGVVGENGAFYFRYDDQARRMIRQYFRTLIERQTSAAALDVIAKEVLAKIPGAAISADQAYREADLAIDFCEDVAPLSAGDVTRIVDIFKAHGAVAKVSSIHVNGWFGDYDKLTMTRRFMADSFALDLNETASAATCMFVGDSPNDAPMFGFFKHSVGVANVRDFLDQCAHRPKWITRARGGGGFAQLAQLILQAR